MSFTTGLTHMVSQSQSLYADTTQVNMWTSPYFNIETQELDITDYRAGVSKLFGERYIINPTYGFYQISIKQGSKQCQQFYFRDNLTALFA